MCDYSLHNVPSRPASTGDNIVITSFRGTPTRGFAPVGNPNLAVCLIPGTELAFAQEVESEGFLPFLRKRKAGGTLARFRQVNVEQPNVHHDALEFPNGKIVLLTNLIPGQHATVLQLPAGKFTAKEVEQVEQPKEACEIS